MVETLWYGIISRARFAMSVISNCRLNLPALSPCPLTLKPIDPKSPHWYPPVGESNNTEFYGFSHTIVYSMFFSLPPASGNTRIPFYLPSRTHEDIYYTFFPDPFMSVQVPKYVPFFPPVLLLLRTSAFVSCQSLFLLWRMFWVLRQPPPVATHFPLSHVSSC